MKKIGLFDSGIGGLSVLRQMMAENISEEYIYVADTARAPFGTKSHSEIIQISLEIIEFLRKVGVEGVVAACNTADTSLKVGQIDFDFSYYGITRVKFQALHNVAIWATEATVKSHIYKNIFEKLGAKTILEIPLQDLVKIVEDGSEDKPFALRYLDKAVNLVAEAQISNILLGCTHFSLIIDMLKKRYPNFNFIDPAQLLAQELAQNESRANKAKNIIFYVTGNESEFKAKLEKRMNLLDVFYVVNKLKLG